MSQRGEEEAQQECNERHDNVTEKMSFLRELDEPEDQKDFWSRQLWEPRRRWTRGPEPSVCTQVERGLRHVHRGW